MNTTLAIHERAATDDSLTYAEITAHVATLAGLSKSELKAVALSVCVHSTGGTTKAQLLKGIETSIQNRLGRRLRTKV